MSYTISFLTDNKDHKDLILDILQTFFGRICDVNNKSIYCSDNKNDHGYPAKKFVKRKYAVYLSYSIIDTPTSKFLYNLYYKLINDLNVVVVYDNEELIVLNKNISISWDLSNDNLIAKTMLYILYGDIIKEYKLFFNTVVIPKIEQLNS